MKHSNSNRPNKITAGEPITIDLVERCLDRLAIIMDRSQTPEVYLPLWERLESEIEQMKAIESMIARALRRVRR